VAAAIAARLCEPRAGAGLAPVLPFGASGEHAGFPGTLSIGTEAVRLVVVELVRHAAADWVRVLVVNGHGGNRRARGRAAELCRHEGGGWTSSTSGCRMDAHAGRAETSIMPAPAPARVRTDLAGAGRHAPLARAAAALPAEGVRAVSPNGRPGRPGRRERGEGERLVAPLGRGRGRGVRRDASAPSGSRRGVPGRG
jgi:creatinine amidohydrolase